MKRKFDRKLHSIASSLVFFTFVVVTALVFQTAVWTQTTNDNPIGQIQKSENANSNDDRSTLKKYPDVEDAIVLFQRGNPAGALKLLETAKSKHPEISPPEIMLSRLYLANKKTREGRTLLQAAALKYYSDPEVWNVLADLQSQAGNFAEAEVLFEKSLSLAKSSKTKSSRITNQLKIAYDGLVKTYERRRVWNRAEFYLLQWKNIAAKDINVLRRLAATQLNLAKVEEARSSLRAARALDSKQLPAEVPLGLFYQQKGEFDKAKTAMNQALAENPNSFGTQAAVARWAVSSGNIKLARQCISICSTLDGNSLVPKLLDASADLFEGNLVSAESKFRKLIQNKPGDFEVGTGLAMTLLRQTQPEKLAQGLEHAKVIAKANPNSKSPRGRQAISLLAWASYRNGHSERAINLIESVIASGEIGADMAYFAAEIFKEKRPQLAKQLVTKAIESPLAFIHRREAQALQTELSKQN